MGEDKWDIYGKEISVESPTLKKLKGEIIRHIKTFGISKAETTIRIEEYEITKVSLVIKKVKKEEVKMICRLCNTRYAPFPSMDFEFIPEGYGYEGRVNGIYPKNKEAALRRTIVFESNDPGCCGCTIDFGYSENYLRRPG
jgi:hypothetical protein